MNTLDVVNAVNLKKKIKRFKNRGLWAILPVSVNAKKTRAHANSICIYRNFGLTRFAIISSWNAPPQSRPINHGTPF